MTTFFKNLSGRLRNLMNREPDQSKTETPPTDETKTEPEVVSTSDKTIPVMASTAPLSPENYVEGTKFYPPQLSVGTGQSVGRQRDHNEDALFALTTDLASNSTHVSFGFFIVADGMGGHQHGEIASEVSVRAMSGYVLRKLFIPMFSMKPEQPEESMHEILQEGVYEAHRAILKEAAGGGTTMTALLVIGNQMMISHVGDSRLYAIYSDGHAQVLTRDHSLVKRLEELGQITSAEAAVHPQRNVLYRALGQGEPFEPDINTFPVPRNAHLLMCSDGLWGLVSEEQIIEAARNSSSLQEACQKLIDAANEAGGPDNISVIIIRTPG